MKKAMIGYQIYSAREDAEKDLFGTLKKIAEMGYDGVEFAGFYHYTVDEIKKEEVKKQQESQSSASQSSASSAESSQSE